MMLASITEHEQLRTLLRAKVRIFLGINEHSFFFYLFILPF